MPLIGTSPPFDPRELVEDFGISDAGVLSAFNQINSYYSDDSIEQRKVERESQKSVLSGEINNLIISYRSGCAEKQREIIDRLERNTGKKIIRDSDLITTSGIIQRNEDEILISEITELSQDEIAILNRKCITASADEIIESDSVVSGMVAAISGQINLLNEDPEFNTSMFDFTVPEQQMKDKMVDKMKVIVQKMCLHVLLNANYIGTIISAVPNPIFATDGPCKDTAEKIVSEILAYNALHQAFLQPVVDDAVDYYSDEKIEDRKKYREENRELILNNLYGQLNDASMNLALEMKKLEDLLKKYDGINPDALLNYYINKNNNPDYSGDFIYDVKENGDIIFIGETDQSAISDDAILSLPQDAEYIIDGITLSSKKISDSTRNLDEINDMCNYLFQFDYVRKFAERLSNIVITHRNTLNKNSNELERVTAEINSIRTMLASLDIIDNEQSKNEALILLNICYSYASYIISDAGSNMSKMIDATTIYVIQNISKFYREVISFFRANAGVISANSLAMIRSHYSDVTGHTMSNSTNYNVLLDDYNTILDTLNENISQVYADDITDVINKESPRPISYVYENIVKVIFEEVTGGLVDLESEYSDNGDEEDEEEGSNPYTEERNKITALIDNLLYYNSKYYLRQHSYNMILIIEDFSKLTDDIASDIEINLARSLEYSDRFFLLKTDFVKLRHIVESMSIKDIDIKNLDIEVFDRYYSVDVIAMNQLDSEYEKQIEKRQVVLAEMRDELNNNLAQKLSELEIIQSDKSDSERVYSYTVVKVIKDMIDMIMYEIKKKVDEKIARIKEIDAEVIELQGEIQIIMQNSDDGDVILIGELQRLNDKINDLNLERDSIIIPDIYSVETSSLSPGNTREIDDLNDLINSLNSEIENVDNDTPFSPPPDPFDEQENAVRAIVRNIMLHLLNNAIYVINIPFPPFVTIGNFTSLLTDGTDSVADRIISSSKTGSSLADLTQMIINFIINGMIPEMSKHIISNGVIQSPNAVVKVL